jgi:hypothetical protein
MQFRKVVTTSLMLVAYACCAPRLQAQGTSGAIVGTVRDSSGAIVPGVSVTIRNQQTNLSRVVRANESGNYNVSLLPPGVYDVSVEQTGFRNELFSNIALEVNQTVRVDVSLVLGNQTEEVEVTETGPLVSTDTSSLGQVIDQQRVSDLPLNQRNFVSLAMVAPGVSLPAEGSNASNQGVAMNVNGARDTSNNYLIDGIDDNDLVINQYSAIPSLDAIQEFKVQSGNYTAEYGRSGGAQVNVLIKSGTNDFHGTIYEFLRNRRMDSKNFFDLPDCHPSSVPGTCSSIPRLDRSQFGGSFGGPIKKDKTFLFVAYEYFNLRDATTRQATVPSIIQRQQALTAAGSLINPAGLNVFNLWPAANVGTNLATSNIFVSAPTSSETEPYFVTRLDHRFSDKDMINGHYVFSLPTLYNAFDASAYTNLPGYASHTESHGQNGGAAWTHLFTSNMLNELRMGFNGERGDYEQADKTNYNQRLGFPTILSGPSDTGYPNVSIAGFDGIGQPSSDPMIHPAYTIHTMDNFAWNPRFDGGKHQLKVGFENRYYIYSIQFDTNARGIWVFNGGPAGNPLNPARNPIIQLLLGTPDNATIVNAQTFEAWRQSSWDAYFQDDYHLLSKLTLNLGLRWEYNSPPTETQNHVSVPDLSPASATCTPKPNCEFILPGAAGLPAATYYPYYKNFDPRIGFAWRPMKTDSFSIRSGFGLYTDVGTINNNLNLRMNPPFRIIQLIQNPTGTSTIQTIVNQPAAITPPTGSFFDPHLKDAYMEQWNLDVQHSPIQNLLLDVGYVGTHFVHLIATQNVNQPDVGKPVPYPQFGATLNEYTNSRSSSYSALQVKVEKRGATEAVLAAYTYSRCIDNGGIGGAGGGTTPQYAFDLKSERGLCSFNASQRLAVSYVSELPIGAGHRFIGHGWSSHVLSHWQLSGIYAIQTGQPFTVARGVPQSLTLPTGTQDRPDMVADPRVAGPVALNPNCKAPARVGIPDMWFNPCAFVAAPGRFGNSGRNNLNAPGYNNWDFSLMKEVKWESRLLQLRGEVYNLFNHPQFDIPNHNFDSPTFGRVQTANAYGQNGGRPPRQIQLGIKFIF